MSNKPRHLIAHTRDTHGPLDENMTVQQRLDVLASRLIQLETRVEAMETRTKGPNKEQHDGKSKVSNH